MSLTFDATDFLKDVKKLIDSMPEVQEKIIITTLTQVGTYAMNVPPTVPLKEGALRRSMGIGMVKGETGTGFIEFTVPYAGVMDRGKIKNIYPIVNWSEPGSGAEFLSGKFRDYAEAFGKTAAETAAKGIADAL